VRDTVGRVEVLPLGVAEVGLGRAQVRPVGLRRESVGRDRDELVVDALARALAQQVPDHPLAFVVLALAEVVVPNPALRVCEVSDRLGFQPWRCGSRSTPTGIAACASARPPRSEAEAAPADLCAPLHKACASPTAWEARGAPACAMRELYKPRRLTRDGSSSSFAQARPALPLWFSITPGKHKCVERMGVVSAVPNRKRCSPGSGSLTLVCG
jgi:hypothetical protein